VSALNLNSKPSSSVPDGMPKVSTPAPAGRWTFPYLRLKCCKTSFPEHSQWKNNRMFFTFFEELKNIENRVAWFLAELCKAEKGVQKDK